LTKLQILSNSNLYLSNKFVNSTFLIQDKLVLGLI